MEDKGTLNSKTISWIATMIALSIIVPYLWHHYIQPVYIAGWFYFNLNLFKGLVYLIHNNPYFADNSDSVLFWVNWVILDGDLKPHTMTQQIIDAFNSLTLVHTDTVITIYHDFVNHVGSYSLRFITISRFSYAILFPLYFFSCIYVVKKILKYNEFKTVFTLDSFATTMAEGFPENLPVVWDNPLAESDLDKGVWAMSPKILVYLRSTGCITDFNEDGNSRFKLDVDATRELLIDQVGLRWGGFKKLTDNEKKVVALALPMIGSPKIGTKITYNLITMLGYAHSGKPSLSTKMKAFSDGLLGVVNPFKLLASKGGNIFNLIKCILDIPDGISESLRRRKYIIKSNREVNRILKEYTNQSHITDIVKRHAYVYTVIAALLREARKGGKLPSCTCMWLKKSDRRLFYVFNNLGRENAWIECVGFWSHDVSERKIKVPFSYPRIDAAIVGIDEYLWSSYYEYAPINDWDENSDR